MRASLLIAAHNEGEALWKTIRSCVEATNGLEYEIVVADDASTDDSIEAARRRFPQIRVITAPQRGGAAPTKHLAAVEAAGEVLVFLDGHTNPEVGSLRRLVEDVETLDGNAIVTPAVPHLDPIGWLNSRSQVGHGYSFRLDTLECSWIPLGVMTVREVGRRRFYDSPALIGCALAIGRGLYQRLWGFDAAMRSWGVEDIDFGLKAWLLGYPILHDPQAIVGHRFRQAFDNYDVPPSDLLANQLRFARKHFSSAVWSEWAEALRLRNLGPLAGHPEGLWARAWSVFEEGRESVEHERQYLMSRRERDEFDYAEAFALDWPRLPSRERPTLSVSSELAPAFSEPSQLQPSPSPSPPSGCELTDVTPDFVTICVGHEQEFVAHGKNLGSIEWTADKGSPPSEKGEKFKVKWDEPQQNAIVSAKCGETLELAIATVIKVSFDKTPIVTGFRKAGANPQEIYVPVVMTVEPKSAVGNVEPRAQHDGHSRFVIRNILRDENTGTISFEVGGQRETPSNKPEGDAKVVTWFTLADKVLPGSGCGVPVVVAIPKYLDVPYPSPTSIVPGENVALGREAVPPVYNVPAGEVRRLTLYVIDLEITVVDQFKKPLTSIYDGSVVQEYFEQDGYWRIIRQKVQAGKYTDPVGDGGFRPGNFSLNDPEVAEWLGSAERIKPPFRTFVQDIPVKIGGHELTNRTVAPEDEPENDPIPAIKNRQVTIENADGDSVKIIIQWPSP